jgi:hypothetical protein
MLQSNGSSFIRRHYSTAHVTLRLIICKSDWTWKKAVVSWFVVWNSKPWHPEYETGLPTIQRRRLVYSQICARDLQMDSSLSMVTVWAERPRFFSLQRPDSLWGPSSPQSNECQRLFPGDVKRQGQTTHLHLTPPYVSRDGVLFKHIVNFKVYFFPSKILISTSRSDNCEVGLFVQYFELYAHSPQRFHSKNNLTCFITARENDNGCPWDPNTF